MLEIFYVLSRFLVSGTVLGILCILRENPVKQNRSVISLRSR